MATFTNLTKTVSKFWTNLWYLLTEESGFLLLESGGKIIGEGTEPTTSWTNQSKTN